MNGRTDDNVESGPPPTLQKDPTTIMGSAMLQKEEEEGSDSPSQDESDDKLELKLGACQFSTEQQRHWMTYHVFVLPNTYLEWSYLNY